MRRFFGLTLFLLTLNGTLPGVATSAETAYTDSTADDPGIFDSLKVNGRNLTFWQGQHPQKPFIGDDNPLNLASDSVENNLRLDFFAQFKRLELSFKPRWDLSWGRWESGEREGDAGTDGDAYVNEWRVRIQPLEGVFLSYGREDLQWGPSMLLSPSNPFFTSNGKSQPKREVPGADYARLVWAIDPQWTSSLIANTDKGRKEMRSDFHQTYAAKIDYTADRGYGSLIVAKRESGDWRVGGFVSWNLDEALILYAEGSRTNDGAEVLLGGSYTFSDGGMVTVEYFRNGFGSASDNLLTLLTSPAWQDFRQVLLRKNYLLLQFYKQDGMGDWSSLLRLTTDLDDHSSALLGAFEYTLVDHVQLFANGTVFHGDNDDELSAMLDYQVMAGVELSF